MIYTFYSYKGGVGRSMAMANVAEWFYQQGLRVVMIDWDLEAPGLENFFASGDEIEKVRAKPGLMDMLLAYKDQYPLLPMSVLSIAARAAAADAAFVGDVIARSLNPEAQDSNTFLGGSSSISNGTRHSSEPSNIPQRLDTASAVEVLEKHLPPLEYFLYPLRPQTVNAQGNQQALWLLSAGWRTKERFNEYGREVQNFSWSEFYEAYHGEAYFEWMRKQLNSNEFADAVLIDSRTGLTEMGGVSTRQLADVVVSFTAPNVQNLNGVVAMAASFKKKEVIEARNRLDVDSKRPLEVVVVPSRVETSGEQEERFFFKEEFLKQFAEYPASFRILKKTFWDLLIPYVAKYAYREKLTIGDTRGSEELQKAYKTLAAHLVLLAPEGSLIRARFADELRRLFGNISPRVLVADSTPSGKTDWSDLRKRFKEVGLTVWDSAGEGADGQANLNQSTGNIDLSEFLVLPVNRESVWSETFRKQWRYARQQGVCVQLIRDSEVELTKEQLPLWLREAQIYDPASDLDKLIEVLKRPCITSRIPYMEPELPESYVKRSSEIKKLVAMLLNSESENATAVTEPGVTNAGPNIAAVPRVALCGPPGCGKTATATAVCAEESVIAAFSDGILWVTLGETLDVPAALNLLYNALTGENTPHISTEQMLAAKLEGKRCLLVVNDVCNESDLRPFLSLLSAGALLFTTRDRSIAAAADAKQLVLGAMTNSEALELLVKQSRVPTGQEPILNEVVSFLGNAPVAIKLAGTALRQRLSDDEPYDAVVDLYKDLQAQGVIAFDQKNSPDRDHSVAKTLTASLDSLDERQRDCFLKLSMLPPETDVALGAVRVLWEQDELETIKLAKRFDSLSLLRYDPTTATVRLGRLMHSFLEAQRADPSILNARIAEAENVFARLTPLEQSLARRVLTRLVYLSRPEDKLPDARKRYELDKFDAIVRPVAETLLKAGLLKLDTGLSDERPAVQLVDDSLVQNWSRLRSWLDDDRPFLTWRQTLEPQIAEWESSRRHNSEVLLKSKALAEARGWLNSRKDDLNESEKLFITESDRVVAKSKRTVRTTVAVSFVVVFILLGIVGYLQYRARRAAQENLVDLSQTRIVPTTALMGEPDEASYRKAIDAYNKVIDANPQFVEAYDGRASAYVGLKDYDKAEEDYRKALDLRPEYVEAWKDLGVVYKLKGDKAEPANSRPVYDQAIVAFTQAIRLRPDYADAYFGRGDTYTARGDRGDKASYDLAIADYTRIIAQLQRDKPTAEAYYKRGLAYRSKGDTANALPDFQKASALPVEDLTTRENALKNLQQLIGSEPPVETPAAPSIFIQYNDPDDEDVVKQVAQDLAKEYKVIGQPQLSAGNAIGNGDVRCFRSLDFKDATKIADLVQTSLKNQGHDKTIKPRDLKDYPNVPPGQIEVWIASLRLSKVPAQVPPSAVAR